MDLLKIKRLFLLTVLFGQLCFADSGDEYWNAYEDQRKSKANYSLVEHVNNLFTSSKGISLEAQEKQANAILYFISIGGKYGFRKAPATAEETKNLQTALWFAGRIKKDSVDILETYKKQHGNQAPISEISTHLEVAQKLFNEANKPLFVFFSPENAEDRFRGFYYGLFQAEARMGRGGSKLNNSFDKLTIDTNEQDSWWNNPEFANIVNQLIPASNPHITADALVQATNDTFDRGVQLLEEVSQVHETVRFILKEINHRHPSKVAFIGSHSFVASLAANFISKNCNMSLGALLLNKTPILWSSRNTLLPTSIVMHKPDLKGAGDGFAALKLILEGRPNLRNFFDVSYSHVNYLVKSLKKSGKEVSLTKVEAPSGLVTVASMDEFFYTECLGILLYEVFPQANPII